MIVHHEDRPQQRDALPLSQPRTRAVPNLRKVFPLLFWAPVVVGFVVRLRGVDRPLNEIHGFRQTQTAFTVREYMRSGIDLAHTPLPVLGPPWDVPFEFPLFQSIAAVAGQLGTDAATASRLTGLFFFEITCALMGLLALQWFSRSTALIGMTLYQLTPFGVQWGWASLIEYLATAAALGAVVAFTTWHKRRTGLLIAIAVVLQVAAFLIKPTTALPWLVAYAVPAVWAVMGCRSWREKWTVVSWASLPPAAAVLAAGLWTGYADRVKAASHYTQFVTSGRLTSWNAGTLDQRADMNSWIEILNRMPALAGGTGVLMGLAIVSMACWRASLPSIAIVLVPAVAIGTFFNLYVQHDYYLCAVYPAVILVVASAIAGIMRALPDVSTAAVVGAALSFGLLVLAWTSPPGQAYQANISARPPLPDLSREIASATSSRDGVIVVGCDWDPTWLYYADRRGLMLRADELTHEVPASWIPGTLSYLAYCGNAAPSLRFLPDDVSAVQVSPHVYALTKTA